MQKNNPLLWLPWIIGFGLLMENIDISIINTAIPQMAISLHTNPLTLKLGITSYLFALVAFIPISGYLADIFGAKKVFSIAICIFLFGSMLCGFAHNLTELVIGRIIQGTGGAMMTPVGRLILLRTYDRKEFIKAFGSLTLLGQIGPALGPVMGGFLTTLYTWRLVFFINLPIALLGLILVYYFIPTIEKKSVPPFDYIGFVLFTVCAGSLIFALSLIAEQQILWLPTLSLFAISIITVIIYYFYNKTQSHPVLDFSVFNIRTFSTAVKGSSIIRLALGGVPFLLPLLFQLGWGMNPLTSGLLLLPYGLAMICAKPYVKKSLSRFGFRQMLIVNPCILAILFVALSMIVTLHSILFLIVVLTFLGFFSSLQFTFMNSLNFVDVAQEQATHAVSLASVFQQMSMSIGVCVAAFLLLLFKINYVAHTTVSLTAFEYAFIGLAIISLASILVFKRLLPEDGRRVI